MPNNAKFLTKDSKALPKSYFDNMGKGSKKKFDPKKYKKQLNKTFKLPK